MKYMQEIVSFGEENELKFYIEAETVSFDYAAGTRDMIIRLYRSAAYDLGRFTGTGTIEIFGKKFSLSTSFRPSEEMEVMRLCIVNGVSGTEYKMSAYADIKFAYVNNTIQSCVFNQKVAVYLGEMCYTPSVQITADRLALGQDISFTGAMLGEGYEINAVLSSQNGELASADISMESPSIGTLVEWISPYKASREFAARLNVSASYKGVPLPNVKEIDLVLYLSENDGRPYVSSRVRFFSDNELVSRLGVAVKNYSSFKVEVMEMSAYYNAYIADCTITYLGVNYSGDTLDGGVLTESGNHTYSVKVTDSRGIAYTETCSFEVKEYAPPRFSGSVIRCDSEGNESKTGQYISASVTLEKTYPFGGVNGYKAYFAYGRVGIDALSEKQELPTDADGYIVNLPLESTTAYEVWLYVEDDIGSIAAAKFLLDCERIELNIAKNKIGVGKYADIEYVLDCAWAIKSGGDITLTDSNGREVSLGSALGGGNLPISGRVYSASSEGEIQDALSCDGEGIWIALVNVLGSALSLGKGMHAFIKYNVASSVGYVKIGG